MGDRCYMEVRCRREDAPLFEELGFTIQDDEPLPPIVRLVDEEANYAHFGELPENVPWLGESGSGGCYNGAQYACDGVELLQVDETQEGDIIVRWDHVKNEPREADANNVRAYYAHVEKVQKMFMATNPVAP